MSKARKNVDLVIAAVRELRNRGLDLRAAIVGRVGWLSERAMREIEFSIEDLQEHIQVSIEEARGFLETIQ